MELCDLPWLPAWPPPLCSLPVEERLSLPGLSVLLGVVLGGPTGVVPGAFSVPWFDGVCAGRAHAGVVMHAVAARASPNLPDPHRFFSLFGKHGACSSIPATREVCSGQGRPRAPDGVSAGTSLASAECSCRGCSAQRPRQRSGQAAGALAAGPARPRVPPGAAARDDPTRMVRNARRSLPTGLAQASARRRGDALGLSAPRHRPVRALWIASRHLSRAPPWLTARARWAPRCAPATMCPGPAAPPALPLRLAPPAVRPLSARAVSPAGGV